MRASLLLDSDPAGAARRANGILAASPGHAEASLLLAAALRKLGDPAAAAAALESLTRERPDSALLQLELARACTAAGRGAEALTALRRAVEIDAGLGDAWRELAVQLLATGETLEGDRAYAHYLRLWREPPELDDATRAIGENRPDAAEALLRRHLKQAPQDVVALRLLASLVSQARCLIARLRAHALGLGVDRRDVGDRLIPRLLGARARSVENIPRLVFGCLNTILRGPVGLGDPLPRARLCFLAHRRRRAFGALDDSRNVRRNLIGLHRAKF